MKSVYFQRDLDADLARAMIEKQRYGVIETMAGRLVAIHFRWLPKLVSWPEWWPVGASYHASGQSDRCLLYYNQPLRCSNYLALKYMVTTRGTSYATFRAALEALDGVAELKQTDALLCDAFNRRISDRLLKRFGWEAHRPQRWHRNFIKRFYGTYPGKPLPGIPQSALDASTPALQVVL